ncbi:MAG: HDOD domain-containing protein, partial [Planctomycetota bacterium]
MPMPPVETTSLAAVADRADRLYTPPAVAMEVLRLTDEPRIDAQALCEVIEADPALAAKLLRVVNSSLYGLPEHVGSLPQAVAILGVQPLKLLVLGFALPDGLLDDLPGEALRSYWTGTLTTATAARLIAELGWGRLGDEALVAGLMQRVGQLVLLGQLGDDYAALVQAAAGKIQIGAAQPIEPAESGALGFEHRELSAELARRWRLPGRIIDAIEAQAKPHALGALSGDEACLAQSLRLAFFCWIIFMTVTAFLPESLSPIKPFIYIAQCVATVWLLWHYRKL